MIIASSGYVVKCADGWDGHIVSLKFDGDVITSESPQYADFMERPHMLPGLISCPPGTAINAYAVLHEMFDSVECDGDLTVPSQEGVLY